MHFNECHEGDYRIYVGAVEAHKGHGYTAALIVNRVRGSVGSNPLAYRDDTLACGYTWPSPHAAMHYATNRGRELIRSRSPLLTC